MCVGICVSVMHALAHKLPESHLEYLSQVDLLRFVVVSTQHLTKQSVIEVDTLPWAFWSFTVLWLQEAGAPISRQLVLLYAPEDHGQTVNTLHDIWRSHSRWRGIVWQQNTVGGKKSVHVNTYYFTFTESDSFCIRYNTCHNHTIDNETLYTVTYIQKNIKKSVHQKLQFVSCISTLFSCTVLPKQTKQDIHCR